MLRIKWGITEMAMIATTMLNIAKIFSIETTQYDE